MSIKETKVEEMSGREKGTMRCLLFAACGRELGPSNTSETERKQRKSEPSNLYLVASAMVVHAVDSVVGRTGSSDCVCNRASAKQFDFRNLHLNTSKVLVTHTLASGPPERDDGSQLQTCASGRAWDVTLQGLNYHKGLYQEHDDLVPYHTQDSKTAYQPTLGSLLDSQTSNPTLPITNTCTPAYRIHILRSLPLPLKGQAATAQRDKSFSEQDGSPMSTIPSA
ncbi:hypothetical protein ACRALDRAFT_205726 [Sodiomyces alcalophilus JCM 7366]|uniref:uncharacterized protein n=1 Tax=Sodiomyces alcalophilus JCM 7366 TaxID=591952 RepID=UPI0039B665DE